MSNTCCHVITEKVKHILIVIKIIFTKLYKVMNKKIKKTNYKNYICLWHKFLMIKGNYIKEHLSFQINTFFILNNHGLLQSSTLCLILVFC